ncbi:hypothetical protein [Dyella choica]|uniref:Uncharacterized protein n=1 Tax=Dyella choica TaxID=1927959 RepID=A0A432M1Z0_9GAMM|nr:hypothetical protein [Dyella choica]RUL71900.1 hypothetical protein EKH80_18600 [Dyella choica]
MTLSPDVAAWLQRNLVIMSIDDVSAIGLSGDSPNRALNETVGQWQFTIDMIYRCLVSGLICVGPTDEWLRAIGLPDIKSFTETLAKINPFDLPGDPGHWFDTYFVDTDYCRLRIAHYGLLNADAAETIARNNLAVLEETPAYYPKAYVKDEVGLRNAATHFFECAAISRAAGWHPGKNVDVLVPAFVEEIEMLFENHGIPWSEKPLIPIHQ